MEHMKNKIEAFSMLAFNWDHICLPLRWMVMSQRPGGLLEEFDLSVFEMFSAYTFSFITE